MVNYKRKTYDRTQVYTRLTPSDLVRLDMMAASRSTSRTDLAREAITWYLENFDKRLSSENQEPYARQLRATTNRICSLLAKIAIDVRTMCQVLAEMHNDFDQFMQYRNAAIKQINQHLDSSEQSVATGMIRNVTGELPPPPPEDQSHG